MPDMWEVMSGGGGTLRPGAPEPSLLVHLARTAHTWDVELLLDVAALVGRHGTDLPPWFPLWEATVDVLVADPPLDAPPPSHELGAVEWEIRRALARGMDAHDAAQRIGALLGGGDLALAALLAPAADADGIRRLVTALPPSGIPAEGARRLLIAVARTGVAVDDGWLADLLAGSDAGEFGFSRRGHLVPAVPPGRRAEVADDVLGELPDFDPPPWYAALVASRVGPLASSPGRWVTPVDDPQWAPLVEHLLRTPVDPEGHDDVRRAHVAADELARIEGRHETTGPVLAETRARWTRPLAQAAPPPDIDADRDVATPAPAPPASVSPPTSVDQPRRLQADVSVGDRAVRRAFVAGQQHAVEISIGTRAAIAARVPFTEPAFLDDADRVTLLVRFLHGDADVQEQAITLRRDRSRDSSVAEFRLTPGAGEQNVTALVAVYHGEHPDQVLQAAVLRGAVVATTADEATAPGSIELDVQAWVADAFDPPASSATASVTTVGGSGGTLALAASGGAAVSLPRTALAQRVDELAQVVEAAAALLVEDPSAHQIEQLLVDLARHGRSLEAVIGGHLPAGFADQSHVQVVAADPRDLLPLELVYDGPPPTASSTVCPEWRDALRAGSCDGCSGRPEDDGEHPRVCPLRFWSLSKVIERHAALTTAGGGFELRSERNRSRNALRALDGVLVGASTKVAARDVRATSRAARRMFRSARRASSWAAWTKAIGGHGPAVLVAMPHQAADDTLQPPLPALELGGDLLVSGAVVPRHVRRDTDDPGPIVLLVGCNTATNGSSLDSFAADFRRNGAPVVIATFGEILADQAAYAVRSLLTRIDEASRQPHGTIGDALLRARRDLLAEGIVLGLLLVAHGDADWELAQPNGGGG